MKHSIARGTGGYPLAYRIYVQIQNAQHLGWTASDGFAIVMDAECISLAFMAVLKDFVAATEAVSE